MSTGFTAVQWNRDKIVYDIVLVAGVVTFIAGYVAISALLKAPVDHLAWIDLRIRACGLCAFLMLTIILCIGPLARLDKRFLKLLYNRRHFGVLTFLVALAHVSFMLEWFAAQNALPSLADRTHQHAGLREIHRLSVQDARHRRAADPVPARRDQPRLLDGFPDAAGVEAAAHGALRRLRAGGDACRARCHAVRSASGATVLASAAPSRW